MEISVATIIIQIIYTKSLNIFYNPLSKFLPESILKFFDLSKEKKGKEDLGDSQILNALACKSSIAKKRL